jgi:hypothetical protein
MDVRPSVVSLSAVFSPTTKATTAAFGFAELVAKLHDVPDEARRFGILIDIVRRDFGEALRLSTHTAVQARFVREPHERNYVVGAIEDVKAALESVGELAEKMRGKDPNGERGVSVSASVSASVKRWSEWLWKYRSRVGSCEKVLDAGHKSMLGAMQRMIAWIDMASSGTGGIGIGTSTVTSPGPPPYQDAMEAVDGELDDDLVAARRRITKYDRRVRSKSSVTLTVTAG